MSIGARTIWFVVCDRCGVPMRDDWPGMPLAFPDKQAALAAARNDRWLDEGETTKDFVVCRRCRTAVEAEASKDIETAGSPDPHADCATNPQIRAECGC